MWMWCSQKCELNVIFTNIWITHWCLVIGHTYKLVLVHDIYSKDTVDLVQIHIWMESFTRISDGKMRIQLTSYTFSQVEPFLIVWERDKISDWQKNTFFQSNGGRCNQESSEWNPLDEDEGRTQGQGGIYSGWKSQTKFVPKKLTTEKYYGCHDLIDFPTLPGVGHKIERRIYGIDQVRISVKR